MATDVEEAEAARDRPVRPVLAREDQDHVDADAVAGINVNIVNIIDVDTAKAAVPVQAAPALLQAAAVQAHVPVFVARVLLVTRLNLRAAVLQAAAHVNAVAAIASAANHANVVNPADRTNLVVHATLVPAVQAQAAAVPAVPAPQALLLAVELVNVGPLVHLKSSSEKLT